MPYIAVRLDSHHTPRPPMNSHYSRPQQPAASAASYFGYNDSRQMSRDSPQGRNFWFFLLNFKTYNCRFSVVHWTGTVVLWHTISWFAIVPFRLCLGHNCIYCRKEMIANWIDIWFFFLCCPTLYCAVSVAFLSRTLGGFLKATPTETSASPRPFRGDFEEKKISARWSLLLTCAERFPLAKLGNLTRIFWRTPPLLFIYEIAFLLFFFSPIFFYLLLAFFLRP